MIFMKKAVVFGASSTGKRIYESIKHDMDVVAFLDEDSEKWGGYYDNVEIHNPDDLLQMDYDYVYVGVLTYYLDVMARLHTYGIPDYKIVDKYVSLPHDARIEFLENAKVMLDEEEISDGNVAELGVYKGDFAKELNRVFHDKKLYLFDTFDGFAASDDDAERKAGFSQETQAGYFSDTSVEYVMSRMPFRDRCVARKGFFPDTAKGLEHEKFIFVNIDADLYEPILAGLRWFYPRMSDGGIVLVHDYYSKAFTGARQAVELFARENHVRFLPVGDTLSVAIRKS